MRDPFSIPHEVLKAYAALYHQFVNEPRWTGFCRAYRSLLGAIEVLPFDPRFNAVHWALDAQYLCRQVAYSFLWMSAYGDYYRQHLQPGQRMSDEDFHVQYYADAAIVLIDSCRDKTALAAWAYYASFNPEARVLDYEDVLDRLRCPARHGLTIRNRKPFLDALEPLSAACFGKVVRYRNLKVHRREPRIQVYDVAHHHGWGYVVPCFDDKERQRLRESIKKQYPDASRRGAAIRNSEVNGVLYDRRRLKDALWKYHDVRGFVQECLEQLLASVELTMRILRRRDPIRRR
jgi:hypothetical protein